MLKMDSKFTTKEKHQRVDEVLEEVAFQFHTLKSKYSNLKLEINNNFEFVAEPLKMQRHQNRFPRFSKRDQWR